MNINTNTLLGMLSPQISTVVKQKIEESTVDGKVNLGTVIQDKTIQSLLTGLFKDLASGVQTKQQVFNLLQNSTQSLSFKNLADDLKSMVRILQNTPNLSAQLSNQITALQNSLVDISKADPQTLKNTIDNSGVFFESKLLKTSSSIQNELTKSIQSFSKLINDVVAKGEIKETSLPAIQKQFSNILLPENKMIGQVVLNDIETLFESLKSPSQNMSLVQKTIASLEHLFDQIKDPKANELLSGIKNLFQGEMKGIQNIDLQVSQILSQPKVSDDLKVEIKKAIDTLLNQAQLPTTSKQIQLQQTLSQQIFSNLSTIDNDVVNVIKGNLFSSFEQVNIKTQVFNFQNILLQLDQFLEQNNFDLSKKTALKEQVQNIFQEANKMVLSPKPLVDQVSLLNNMVHSLKNFESELQNQMALMEQNKGIPKQIANDLKGVILQIQETIENSFEPVNKELRTMVEKVATQIEYFQLLSYSANAPHTYLSFLQDNIEDADITFHKSKDDTFSCQINLSLKEKGEVKILLLLDKEVNLGVNIGVAKEFFLKEIQQNLQTLRQGINKAGLLLHTLNIFSLDDKKTQMDKVHHFYGNAQASFGVDVKV